MISNRSTSLWIFWSFRLHYVEDSVYFYHVIKSYEIYLCYWRKHSTDAVWHLSLTIFYHALWWGLELQTFIFYDTTFARWQ